MQRGNNNLPLIWLRQTAQTYDIAYNYNSLPRRAAMTRQTHCLTGQQQQPGLSAPHNCNKTKIKVK